MALSSFYEEFILDSKSAEKLEKMLENPPKSMVKIDRTLTSEENIRRGEEKIKKILL